MIILQSWREDDGKKNSVMIPIADLVKLLSEI